MEQLESASPPGVARARALFGALKRWDASRPRLLAALVAASAYFMRVHPLDVTRLAAAARELSAGAGWSGPRSVPDLFRSLLPGIMR